MQRFSPSVLIDEIQYAPELLPYIKMYVDKQRQAGQFWLTSSQQFHLMQGVSESLAGRVGVVRLLGLSRRESLGQGTTSVPFLPSDSHSQPGNDLSLQALYQLIWRGSYSAIALSTETDRNLFYSSYPIKS